MIKTGTVLHTMDGRKIGNAVITGSEQHEALGRIYSIRTDFGNTTQFTRPELDMLFYISDEIQDANERLENQRARICECER